MGRSSHRVDGAVDKNILNSPSDEAQVPLEIKE